MTALRFRGRSPAAAAQLGAGGPGTGRTRGRNAGRSFRDTARCCGHRPREAPCSIREEATLRIDACARQQAENIPPRRSGLVFSAVLQRLRVVRLVVEVLPEDHDLPYGKRSRAALGRAIQTTSAWKECE